MSTSPLSPEEIRAAAEAHRELGPEYSDAVVASFLEKVDKEIAARVDARLAGPLRTTPAEPGSRSTLLKGIAIGIAISGASIFLVGGNPYEVQRRLPVVLILLALVFAAGAAWAGRQRTSRRAAAQRGPRTAASGDYQRPF
jgi:hypothetical protein